MKLKVQVAKDKSHLLVTPEQGVSTKMTAENIENFISLFAEYRKELLPLVSQSQLCAHNEDLQVDAHDPLFYASKLAHNHDALMLSIGYQGLGWRTSVFSREDAILLANTILLAVNENVK